MGLLTANFVFTDTKTIEWRKQGATNSTDTLALDYYGYILDPLKDHKPTLPYICITKQQGPNLAKDNLFSVHSDVIFCNRSRQSEI